MLIGSSLAPCNSNPMHVITTLGPLRCSFHLVCVRDPYKAIMSFRGLINGGEHLWRSAEAVPEGSGSTKWCLLLRRPGYIGIFRLAALPSCFNAASSVGSASQKKGDPMFHRGRSQCFPVRLATHPESVVSQYPISRHFRGRITVA